jgi:hypothetical protein
MLYLYRFHPQTQITIIPESPLRPAHEICPFPAFSFLRDSITAAPTLRGARNFLKK